MPALAALLAALLSSAPVPAPQVTGNPALAPGLSRRMLEQISLHGSRHWRTGLAVVSCRKDSLLFGYNATTALSPASNQKLLVTACALANWNDTTARRLDSLLDLSPTRKHRIASSPVRADSYGLNAHPEFPGYRHLVLANRESDNMEAQWMLDILSRDQGCAPQTLVGAFLDSCGVPHGGLRVADGCGLARSNRVSPLTLARLLHRIHSSPCSDIFWSTLARPCQPGTLVHRNLNVGDRLAGKTGFIRNVFALSGYLSAEDDTFAFSFILNGCGSGSRAYSLFNGLLDALYGWDSDLQAGRLAPSDTGSGQN